jgi:hypothetical protein
MPFPNTNQYCLYGADLFKIVGGSSTELQLERPPSQIKSIKSLFVDKVKARAVKPAPEGHETWTDADIVAVLFPRKKRVTA